MSTLREILARHCTDKDTAHSYGAPYEKLLEPRRDTAQMVLEIGVFQGGSLRAWRDYFTRANVLGLEVDPQWCYWDGERITTLIGDQTDPDVLALLRTIGPFDVIIDDGSHDPDDQVATLEGLWAALRPGGVYVIEDVQASRHVSKLARTAPDGSVSMYCGDRPVHDDRLLIIEKPL